MRMFNSSVCTQCDTELDADLKATGFEVCDACVGYEGAPATASPFANISPEDALKLLEDLEAPAVD